MTHLMKQMRLLNNNTIYMNRGSECTSSGSLGQVLQRSNAQSQILHFCNIMYETLLTVTVGVYDLHTNKEARKLAGITMVAAGYDGDMPENVYAMSSSMTLTFTSTRPSAAKSNRCSLNLTRWLRKRLRGLLQMCSIKNASYVLTVNT